LYKTIIMSFFHFIDTIFFVSLGITFVLITFLAYHFKERLNVIETKTDTMFQIVNNVVHELKNIKTMVILSQRPPMYVPHTNSLPTVLEDEEYEENNSEDDVVDDVDDVVDDVDDDNHDIHEGDYETVMQESDENLVKVIHIENSVEPPVMEESENDVIVHKLEKTNNETVPISLYKMSVHALRDLALSKNLITESNKLKKSDLVALLSSHSI